MASIWVGAPQLEQYFTCPAAGGTVGCVNVGVGGALILKNAIANIAQAAFCTIPPGTAIIRRVLNVINE
jgi:hypothetical protein